MGTVSAKKVHVGRIVGEQENRQIKNNTNNNICHIYVTLHGILT